MRKQSIVTEIFGISKFQKIPYEGPVYALKEATGWKDTDICVRVGDCIYNLGSSQNIPLRQNVVDASYVVETVEEGKLTFPCKVDTVTHEVFDIDEQGKDLGKLTVINECVDTGEDALNMVFDVDAIIENAALPVAISTLETIIEHKSYWKGKTNILIALNSLYEKMDDRKNG